MMKENLYWQVIFVRYKDPAGWEQYSRLIGPMFAPEAPEEVQMEAAEAFKKVMLDRLMAHGIGVHTDEEAHQIFIEDLRATSDFLGNKAFFFGDKPTTADATVYATLSNLLETPLDSVSTQFGRSRRNLLDYCNRMRERFFPDLPRG
jgi:glutathione S-transferase